jgi:hypothetical protein
MVLPIRDFSQLHTKKELRFASRRVARKCDHVEFRRNVTMQLFALSTKNRPFLSDEPPVYSSFQWMAGGPEMKFDVDVDVHNATEMVRHLDSNFFLVSTTEHINEFLVLIGMHMGWVSFSNTRFF